MFLLTPLTGCKWRQGNLKIYPSKLIAGCAVVWICRLPAAFLCGVYMASLCLHGFPQSKYMQVSSIGHSKWPIGVNRLSAGEWLSTGIDSNLPSSLVGQVCLANGWIDCHKNKLIQLCPIIHLTADVHNIRPAFSTTVKSISINLI